MTDQLNKIAEETVYKIVLHGAETYDVVERVKKWNKETILAALHRAVELERNRVVVQNYPVIESKN